MVEGVFICGGVFFVGILHPLLAAFVFFLALVRNTKPLNKLVRLFVTVFIVIMMIFSVDSMAILFGFLIYAGIGYVLLYLAAVAAFVAPIARFRPLELSPFHGLLAGVIVVLFLQTTIMVSSPGKAACRECRQTPGVDLVIDHQTLDELNLTPRFLRLDPEETTLYVGYRFPFFNNKPELEMKYGLVILDTATGKIINPKLDGGEVIGMAFDPVVDAMLCLLVYKTGGPDHVDCWLTWIARDGRIVDRIPIKTIPWNEYFGALLPDEHTVTVYSGKDVSERLDRATRRIDRVPSNYTQGAVAATDSLQIGNQSYFSFGGSLIELFIQAAVVLADTQTGKVLHSSPCFPFGAYVLACDRMRDEIYTNSQFSGTLWVLDKQLRPLRQVKMGGVVRALAMDDRERRGYIAQYVRGDVVAFDLDTGVQRGSVPLVKSVRSMVVDRNGMLYAGSGCGVFRIHPDVWKPSTSGNGIQFKIIE
ncbi:MAG TPA: hypothetical protein PK961_01710 [bacterium]|nr:hypothetical protein [bacterium]